MIVNRSRHRLRFLSHGRRLIVPVGFLGLTLFSSCAREGTPQGGPPDKTAPTVAVTIPGTGAISVPRAATVTIEFSEPIEASTFLSDFQVSPPLAGRPKVEWSSGGRRVHLSWADSLRANSTYRVAVGTRTSDRNKNTFAAPFTFAFSTGPALDRGRLHGRVRVTDDKPRSVDLFVYRREGIADTFWLCPPDYVTQSDKEGRFDLPFVVAGWYRLLALEDGDRNRRLDVGEAFGLAPDVSTTDDKPADSVVMFLNVYDTTAFRLAGCTPSPAGGVVLSFSHPIDTVSWRDAVFSVRDSANSTPVPVAAVGPSSKRPTVVVLYGTGAVPSAPCLVTAAGLRDRRGRVLSGMDTCRFAGMSATDTVGPRVEWAQFPSPPNALSPRDPIAWGFSKPADTARLTPAIVVRDSLGNAIPGRIVWTDPRTVSFVPENAWPDSLLVYAALDSAQLVDWQGHRAPMQRLNWTFTPLTASDLGAVEGKIAVADSADTGATCRLEIAVVGAPVHVDIVTHPLVTFATDLPAGRWVVTGFVDRDGDGRWNPGALRPFHAPEPRMIWDDTLDVRARFTLENVVLPFP